MNRKLGALIVSITSTLGIVQACTPSSNPGQMTDRTAVGFTLGGNISGLIGPGLVLSLNDTETLPIVAAGSFSFATRLASGSPYTVAVKAHPAFQTCTVMSGSGTVDNVNVFGVSVLCSSKPFSLGGTVTGLSGTLVLQNNGGDDLTVGADGAFQFTTPGSTGAKYAVTVKTQPMAQICSVAAGTGTIPIGGVSGIVVSCISLVSCQDWILKAPTSKDGPYYIKPDSTAAYQVWCDMTFNGGGWTLAMRFKNDGVLGFNSTYWTDANPFNEDAGGSVDPSLNANAKTMAFVNLPGTTVRGCKGVPAVGQCFQQGLLGGKTLKTVFSENFRAGGPSRSVVVGLWGDDTSQPNCNGTGINNYTTYMGPGSTSGARFGLVGNNEMDCLNTDSAWGFGVYGCNDMARACGAGASLSLNFSCAQNCTQGTLWVR